MDQNDQFIVSAIDRPPQSLKRRIVFWSGIAVAVIVFLFVWRLASAYSTIVVENPPWWQTLANVISGGANETLNPEELNEQEPLPSPEPDRYDVLILGIRGDDSISISQEGGLLTDTILVLSYNQTTSRASIISVPRDLYFDGMVTGLKDGSKYLFRGKINEAYERGLARGQGLAFASQIVSRVTNVYIDKAIMFNFDAFKTVVDELGGIDVTLTKPFKETQQWGYEFSLPAGQNHLNGEQALYYARSRFQSSDFDRALRQHQVILSIKDKATRLGVIANPIKITALLDSLKGNMKTNIELWQIKDLIEMIKNLQGNAVSRAVLTTENSLVEAKLENGTYVLLPMSADYGEIRRIFSETLQPTAKQKQ